MDSIKKYYILCGIKSPQDKEIPMVTDIAVENLEIIFTRKQVELYIKKSKDSSGKEIVSDIKETIIGGAKKKKITIL